MKKKMMMTMAVGLLIAGMTACGGSGSRNSEAGGDTPEVSKTNQSDSQTAEGGDAVIFDNGKLGPIAVGQPVGNLAKQVDGLYDKFEYKKEEHEDDMDGSWTEEYYLFVKNGLPVFRANIDGGSVYSIRLMEGSQFIKTADGIWVGMPVSELLEKQKLKWETYFEGEVFATKGHYTYYVSSADVPSTDIPQKTSDFKNSAKVSGIVFNK